MSWQAAAQSIRASTRNVWIIAATPTLQCAWHNNYMTRYETRPKVVVLCHVFE